VRAIDVPDELLDLLNDSRLVGRSEAEQVRAALAIHLFQEGLISVGKAAELADVPRVEFELVLVQPGIQVVRYGGAEYGLNQEGIARAERNDAP